MAESQGRPRVEGCRLACISHAASDLVVLTAFRSVGLLDVLSTTTAAPSLTVGALFHPSYRKEPKAPSVSEGASSRTRQYVEKADRAERSQDEQIRRLVRNRILQKRFFDRRS